MQLQDLFEAVGAPVLYHGTSFRGLLAIFADNTLRGYPTDVRRAGKMAHDGPPSVSLTRDLRAAQSHAGKDIRKTEGGQAIVVFDRDKLRQRYGRKLQPVDVLQIRGHSPDNPFTGVSEFEERIEGDIPNVVSYITGVIIDDQDSFAHFEQETVAQNPAMAHIFSLIRSKL